MPALFFGNYSESVALADELSLVRPDQSYRADYDESCITALSDDFAVYMVYTIEEGAERFVHDAVCNANVLNDAHDFSGSESS